MVDLSETIAAFNTSWNAGEYGDLGSDSWVADETEYNSSFNATDDDTQYYSFASDWGSGEGGFEVTTRDDDYDIIEYNDLIDEDYDITKDPGVLQQIGSAISEFRKNTKSWLSETTGFSVEEIEKFAKSMQGIMGYTSSKGGSGGSSQTRRLVRSATPTAPAPRASGYKSTPVKRATPAQQAASNTASLIRQAQQNGTSTKRIENARLATILGNLAQLSDAGTRVKPMALPQEKISVRKSEIG